VCILAKQVASAAGFKRDLRIADVVEDGVGMRHGLRLDSKQRHASHKSLFAI
jgi:hypothetical protein